MDSELIAKDVTIFVTIRLDHLKGLSGLDIMVSNVIIVDLDS